MWYYVVGFSEILLSTLPSPCPVTTHTIPGVELHWRTVFGGPSSETCLPGRQPKVGKSSLSSPRGSDYTSYG